MNMPSRPTLALLTDFGLRDTYVAIARWMNRQLYDPSS